MVENISPAKALSGILEGAFCVIDVRTEEEFLAGHIEGAKNIDIYEADFLEKISNLSKDKKYLVYCRSGSRSHEASLIMSQSGLDVLNMEGGILGWGGSLPLDVDTQKPPVNYSATAE